MATKKKSKSKVIKKTVASPVIKNLDTKTKYTILGFFIILAFFLYYQCLLFGYVLDDKIVITDNAHTKNGFKGLWDLLANDSFQGYFGVQKDLLQGGRYRPLSLMTFAIEHQLWGLNSAISHHINVLLYGLSGFFSFITLRRLFGEKTFSKKVFLSLSFLTAVLFVLHPIHTEAVANIKGRDEIMAFIFSILALFYALRSFDHGKLIHLAGMVVCFFLGLLSKENTITFLAIIPFGILLFRPKNSKKVFKIFGMLLFSTIIYLIIRYQVIGYLLNNEPIKDIMNNPFYGMSGLERLSTVFYTLIIYLKLNFFPHPLTHDYYPYHIPIMNLKNAVVWLSVLLHIFIGAGVFYFWKKDKKIAFAFGFYLAAMSIVSNLFVDVGTFMNERFAFTASLATCLLIVYLVKKLVGKYSKNQNITLVSLGIIAILFGMKTIFRVPAWETALTLNTEAIKVSKNSARANSFMATALFEEYKITTDQEKKKTLLEEASPYALKALTIYPSYYNGNLMRAGIAAEKYKLNRNLDELLAEFYEIIKVRPDVDYLTEYLNYLNDRADNDTMTRFYINSGRILINSGVNVTWAVHYLLMGNKLDPQNSEIKSLLVQGYTMIGRPADAAKFR